MSRRRWLVPEVVQSSAMDCGPAALKSLLAGHSIPVAYDRLREACHTDVDGSSIDVLEDVAVRLGLDAAQVLEPVEHVFLPEAELLPAIGIVRLPDGLTHFIVIWRRHGPMVQVMDPAVGRRWVTVDELRDELHRHEHDVPATAFREYAASDKFLAPLRRRLVDLGVGSGAIGRLVATATSDDGWEGLAALDGAIRLCKEWVDSGAARRGPEAATLVSRFAREGNQRLAHKAAAAAGPGEGMVRLRGTVLLSVAGRREASSDEVDSPFPEPAAGSRPPEASGPRELWRLLRTDGALGPGVVIVSVAAAAVSTVLEAVIWRSLLDLSRIVGLGSAQLAGLVSIFAFLVGSLLVDVATFAAGLRMGRRLETRLRIALLAKIPLLADRYFATRPRSDLAERSHSVHALRNSAVRVAELMRHAFQLLATAGAIIWIDRRLAFAAVATAALALLVPLCALPSIRERDMRIRVHGGALTRVVLDAFLGLVAIRAHGAEATMRRSHDDLLVEWLRAVRRKGRTVLAVDTLQTLLGSGLAAWLVLGHVAASGVDGTILLVAYWALELPRLGQATLSGLRGLAEQRNILARVLEPLGSVEDEAAKAVPARDASRAGATAHAVHVVFAGVTVRAAGRTILGRVDLEIPAGSHVAIVGASGAGKSTLVGVLLGFHRPAAGTILVDGRPLDEDGGLARLRSETVWVDSSVQIWNRTLLDNVVSGCERDALDLTAAMEHGDLRSLCASLPEGLQTVLGDGGAHLSEGEGQRVRLLRAFCRRGSRLVLLDEAFGGLARAERREQLARARDAWHDRTLLCVTHDIGETRDFPRVLVVDDGQVVEDGRPDELLGRRASRYRRLMEAEDTVRERVLGGPGWRRLRIHRGRLRP